MNGGHIKFIEKINGNRGAWGSKSQNNCNILTRICYLCSLTFPSCWLNEPVKRTQCVSTIPCCAHTHRIGCLHKQHTRHYLSSSAQPEPKTGRTNLTAIHPEKQCIQIPLSVQRVSVSDKREPTETLRRCIQGKLFDKLDKHEDWFTYSLLREQSGSSGTTEPLRYCTWAGETVKSLSLTRSELWLNHLFWMIWAQSGFTVFTVYEQQDKNNQISCACVLYVGYSA